MLCLFDPQDKALELPTLEELVAEIKRLPRNPANLWPGNMTLLAECLAHPVTEPDPHFDVKEWEKEWDRLEAEMKAMSLAEAEESLRKDFIQ